MISVGFFSFFFCFFLGSTVGRFTKKGTGTSMWGIEGERDPTSRGVVLWGLFSSSGVVGVNELFYFHLFWHE